MTELEREIHEEIDHVTQKYDLDMPYDERRRISEVAFTRVASDGETVLEAIQYAINNF